MLNISLKAVTPIFIGVTFFLITGCSTLSSTTDKPLKENSYTEESIREEIKDLNKKITRDSANADLLYNRGYLLSELAQLTEHPKERTETYRDMQKSLTQAIEIFRQTNLPSGIQKSENLLKVRWSSEHNQGVQIVQNDSTLTDKNTEKAILHFNNATIILPDTAISYQMMARTQFKNQNIDGAISTLERARNNIDPLPVKLLEQLAFLYLENDREKQAINIYEEAQSFTPDNLNLYHGLANAYITAGEHEKAVKLLDTLIESNPENTIYRQTKATELYYWGTEKLQEISVTSPDSAKIEHLFSTADSLFNEAEKLFHQALNTSSQNERLKRKFVTFYQNTSSKYQEILTYLNESDAQKAEQTITRHLKSSIPVIESLLQKDPSNPELLNSLYLSYRYLGMDEEAKKINSNL